MSPEQARGEPIDGRTDLYAAGIILWELLTGRQLFPQSEGPDLIERVRHPRIDPPSTRAPRVPPMLDQIVLKALAESPDDRYPTGEAYRAALASFLASNPNYVATDAAKLSAFLHELFDEDIAKEQGQRQELLDHLHERLEENRKASAASMAAALEKEKRKADLLQALERQLEPGGRKETAEPRGGLREDDLSGRILEQLAQNDTEKMIGSTIERWKIKRKIGEGGMGRVFEAEHLELGKSVAIKILHQVYSRTPEVVARFRMEARAASRIGHPNIVEVTDSGTTSDGAFYFVMELLEGIDLADTLSRETRLPVRRALSISLLVANALAAAHQINIVHRDLKPENIYLVNREGNADFVKVLDFGIAKSLEEEKTRLTSPGMAMGTPEYMAPEQAGGKGCDARSDIYSLGAILYEMLSGRAPIEGDNLMEILMRKATEDPVDIAALRPDTAGEVSRLVMRALARDPADRPQTMEVLAAEISRCLQSLSDDGPAASPQVLVGAITAPSAPALLPAGAASALARADEEVTYDIHPEEEDRLHEAKRRQLRQVGGIVGAGVLVGLVAALYMHWTTPEEPRPVAGVRPPPPRTLGAEVITRPVEPPPRVEPPPPVKPSEPARTERLVGSLKLPPPLDVRQARAKIEEGQLAINSGRYEAAYRLCYDAAGSAQVRGLALTCMGEAEFARSNYQRAIEIGKRALKEKPGKDVYLLLGNAYLKTHNCREAKSYYTRVILGADSTNPEALRGLDLCSKQ
jgi:serine/threonine protein kinase